MESGPYSYVFDSHFILDLDIISWSVIWHFSSSESVSSTDFLCYHSLNIARLRPSHIQWILGACGMIMIAGIYQIIGGNSQRMRPSGATWSKRSAVPVYYLPIRSRISTSRSTRKGSVSTACPKEIGLTAFCETWGSARADEVLVDRIWTSDGLSNIIYHFRDGNERKNERPHLYILLLDSVSSFMAKRCVFSLSAPTNNNKEGATLGHYLKHCNISKTNWALFKWNFWTNLDETVDQMRFLYFLVRCLFSGII